jgi:hypothetical protein
MAGITAAAITVACITTVVIMAACITVAYTEDMDTTPVITGAGIIIRTLDTFGTAVGTSMASVPREGPAITRPSRSHDMPRSTSALFGVVS